MVVFISAYRSLIALGSILRSEFGWFFVATYFTLFETPVSTVDKLRTDLGWFAGVTYLLVLSSTASLIPMYFLLQVSCRVWLHLWCQRYGCLFSLSFPHVKVANVQEHFMSLVLSLVCATLVGGSTCGVRDIAAFSHSP